MSRPDRLVVVCGTATEVGKTWVACHLLNDLRQRGVAVAARKPAQSFADNGLATDAELLAIASGQAPKDVCPAHRWYPVAMAPTMAADMLGREAFSISDLAAETIWPISADIGIVETAGGVRSPLASDGDTVTLCRLLAPDAVVLVAHAGLGTINAVRLSAGALADASAPVVVYLNRYDAADELHRRNRDWLSQRDHFEIAVSTGALADRLTAPVASAPSSETPFSGAARSLHCREPE